MPLLKLRAPLSELAGGHEHRLDGATVGEVLRAFEMGHEPLRGWVLDERGLLREHLLVFVDGSRAALDTPLGPDDRVQLLNSITGG